MLNMLNPNSTLVHVVQFNAKVNDRTDAVVRLTSGNSELGNSQNGGNADAQIDRAYVNHKFGERVSLESWSFPVK